MIGAINPKPTAIQAMQAKPTLEYIASIIGFDLKFAVAGNVKVPKAKKTK